MRLIVVLLLAVTAAGAQQPSADELRTRLKAKPDWQQGWWELGSLLYDSDQYAGAAEALARLVELRPDAAPGWALLGLSEYELRRYGPALTHIEKSLALGVQDQPQMEAVLRFHEAVLLTRDRQFDRAMQKFASFVPKEIKDPQLLAGLGLLALRRASLPTEVSPKELPLINSAGTALAELLTGVEGASTHFRDLAAVNAEAPGVQFAYGFAMYATDQEASIAAFKRELAHHPDSASANALLAWTYFLRNDSGLAVKYARAALQAEPEQPVANLLVGRWEVEHGHASEGLTRLKAIASREPENLEAHLALAHAYSLAGDQAETQRERQTAIQLVTQARTNAVARQ